MKRIYSIILASFGLYSSAHAVNTYLHIINKTATTLNVSVIDSDHFDCQLNGQQNSYNCGNSDGNAEPPGALNIQVIPPNTQILVYVLQNGANSVFASGSTMLVKLTAGGEPSNYVLFDMYTVSGETSADGNNTADPDTQNHYSSYEVNESVNYTLYNVNSAEDFVSSGVNNTQDAMVVASNFSSVDTAISTSNSTVSVSIPGVDSNIKLPQPVPGDIYASIIVSAMPEPATPSDSLGNEVNAEESINGEFVGVGQQI